MAEDNGAPGSVPDQLWRLRRVQEDILKRLDKIEGKLEKSEQAQNEQRWRMDNIDSRVGRVEQKPANAGNFLLGESPLVRTILLSLLAMVGALATGTWLSTMGFFK